MAEIFYRPHKAMCDDGKWRIVRVRSYYDGRNWCMYADTFFSVPANVRVNGKYIAGYVTGRDWYDFPNDIAFHAHGRWRGIIQGE